MPNFCPDLNQTRGFEPYNQSHFGITMCSIQIRSFEAITDNKNKAKDTVFSR